MADFKIWTTDGHLVPDPMHSESQRPHMENALPAAWLPTADGLYDASIEEYITVLPGKAVAKTRQNDLVPAGLLKKYQAAAGGDTVLEYSTVDRDHKVTNLVTGTYVTAAVSYTKDQVETALRNLNVLQSTEDLEKFISAPMGVVPYSYLNRMGSDPFNPNTHRLTNFNLQHKVAILTDYVIKVPVVPVQAAGVPLASLGSFSANTESLGTNVYVLTGTNTDYLPWATSVKERLPWTFDADPQNVFSSQVHSKRAVNGTGKWHVDDANQKLYFYHTGALAVATAAVGTSEAYLYHYNAANDSHVDRNIVCAVGDIKPGDYVTVTPKSNYIPVTQLTPTFSLGENLALTVGGDLDATVTSTSATSLTANFNKIVNGLEQLQTVAREDAMLIGQVLDVVTGPKGGLDRVKTFGEGRDWTNNYKDRLPGSATAGQSDLITWSKAANKYAIINIIKK